MLVTKTKKSPLIAINISIHFRTKRIMQEHFQPKISRKTRIFRLGRKNNILKKKKECNTITLQSQLKTKINCISKTEKQVKKGNKTCLFILSGCQLQKNFFFGIGKLVFYTKQQIVCYTVIIIIIIIIITTAIIIVIIIMITAIIIIIIIIIIITIIIDKRFYSSLSLRFFP